MQRCPVAASGDDDLLLGVAKAVEGPTHRATEVARLREALAAHEVRKVQLQRVADGCVEKLFELSHALDAMEEQLNDDSLLQFMLFSTA